jgi:hypothetical protein
MKVDFKSVRMFGMACAGLSLVSHGAIAQATSEQAGDSLLKKPADFSKWEISYSYPKVDAPGVRPPVGTEPKSLVTTKTGGLIHEQVTDIQGRVTDVWHAGPTQYRKPPGETTWYQPVPPSDSQGGSSDYSPIPPNGYRGWDWVGAASFAGTFPFEGVPCLVFLPGGRTATGSEESKATAKIAASPVAAYVNAETRLPVMMRLGNVTSRMTFHTAPTVAQTLPTDLVEQAQKAEQGRKNLFQLPSKPF